MVLGHMGRAAVPGLAKTLENNANSDVRLAAAEAFWWMGPEVTEALPALIKALQDKSLHVRHRSALTLGPMGPNAEKAVPALIQLLQDDVSTAAQALGDIGPGAHAAVPAILSALQKDGGVQEANLYSALGRIGPRARDAVPFLTQSLKDPRHQVRRWSAMALGDIGSPASQTTSALVSCLQDDNDLVRARAAQSLGQIGCYDKGVVSALTKAFQNDASMDVRAYAAFSLGRIALDNKDAVLPLIDALAVQKTFPMQYVVHLALAEAGSAARPAIPTLEAALKESGKRLRLSAAYALVKLGEQSTGMPVLANALMNEDERDSAIQALTFLGPAGAATLTEASKDADPDLRDAAAEALEEIRRGHRKGPFQPKTYSGYHGIDEIPMVPGPPPTIELGPRIDPLVAYSNRITTEAIEQYAISEGAALQHAKLVAEEVMLLVKKGTISSRQEANKIALRLAQRLRQLDPLLRE